MTKALITILFFITVDLYSQSTPACDSLKWAREGTYEIINLTKEREVFTTDVLCVIENNRKEYESVELQISPITLIRIYPRQKVKNTSAK